ncbi:Uncharacterised protein [Brucella suis]|nr:Uncharacterised protein [Brucella suis]
MLGHEFQEWLDVQHLEFAAADEPRHDHAHQRHIGEHRNGDAEHHGDGEAANRAGAEQEQKDGCRQRRDIGVHDGGKGAVEALVERRHRAKSLAGFFTDALVDENIRIDRDADAENNACDTGQRQRCADQA